MDLLDMTITNVALPTLARDFSASTTTIQGVVTGYLLSLAVFIPVSGWAGDRFGTKRVFMFALFLFTLGSFLCGTAWDIESLIAFRVLQGAAGGMLTPVGTAMLFRAFPPVERAVASAVLSIPIVMAPASGPVLGGYLVEYQSWRWIFLINIPVGITGLLVAAAFLREERQAHPGRLAWAGRRQGGPVRLCRPRPARRLHDRRTQDAGADDRRAAVPQQAVPRRQHSAVHGLRRHARRPVPAAAPPAGGDGAGSSGVRADDVPPGDRRVHDGPARRAPLPAYRAAADDDGRDDRRHAHHPRLLARRSRDQPVVDPPHHARPRLVVRADPDPDPDGDVRDHTLGGHGPGERDLQRRAAGGGELRRGAARDGPHESPEPPRRRPGQPPDAGRGPLRLPRGVPGGGGAGRAGDHRSAPHRRQGGRGDDAARPGAPGGQGDGRRAGGLSALDTRGLSPYPFAIMTALRIGDAP